MGMDIVDMVLDIEERFGISLPDVECQNVITVDDCYQLVLSKLDKADQTKCLTSATFYRIRRVIADTLGVDKRTLKPDTPLQDLLPVETRRTLWASIGQRLVLQLPELGRSPGWEPILIGVPLLSLIVPLVLAAMDILEMGEFVAIAASGIFVTWVLARATEPLKKYFHPESLTLGALTKTVLALNVGSLSSNQEGLSKNDVYTILLEIIADNTGLSADEIKPHHAFIDDLRMD
ncbi:MAG: acyl carrier protein [Nitrospinota bacterium]|nr:acyl carrier protein [Nitrospinota bacterium]